MDKNTIMEIEFPYTQDLLNSAKAPYVNHTTSYAIPMMILCGLTSIPKMIKEPSGINIASVIIMIVGAIILFLTNKKQIELTFGSLYQPTEDTIAKVTMDDRFYKYEIKNKFNTLFETHSFCKEITDIIPTKKTIGLIFNQNQYTVIATDALPRADVLKDLKKTIKAQPFGTQQMYKFFSIILGCLTVLNIIGWLPAT